MDEGDFKCLYKMFVFYIQNADVLTEQLYGDISWHQHMTAPLVALDKLYLQQGGAWLALSLMPEKLKVILISNSSILLYIYT